LPHLRQLPGFDVPIIAARLNSGLGYLGSPTVSSALSISLAQLCPSSPKAAFRLSLDGTCYTGYVTFRLRWVREVSAFYIPLPDGIDLVRIVHGSRNLKRLLTEGFLPGPPS
jgi:hypothetical protein